MATSAATTTKPRGVLREGGYNFVDKDPVVDRLRGWVRESGRTYKALAEASALSASTVQNLFSGKTRRPQERTLQRLGALFGKRLDWVDTGGGPGGGL